jgi:omega-6 fatty acid desaturase (delta-12 desaturase)
VHHLSSKIPNYRLAACHAAHPEQFAAVTRLRPGQIAGALKCILWDREAGRIISVAEYRRRQVSAS